MKTLGLLLLCCLAAFAAIGQTVYSIPANTKGNQLTLTVANESVTTGAMNVLVTLQKHPPAISFKNGSRIIKVLPAGKEADVLFTFDVDRDAKLNTKDTLDFLISDRTGSTWTKSIIVSYTGPQEYKLEQNFPNPFNPSTTIYYQLPFDSKVTLKVYDMLGREVRTLVDQEQQAGYKDVRFDAFNVATGAYFCRLHAEPLGGMGAKGYVSTVKMLLMK